MLHIALCDDEKEQLCQVDALLREYQARHPAPELRTKAFSSGAALLAHVSGKGPFDLYLLDVIMPGENGIGLGLEIRKYDRGGRIFYLTTSPDFAVDSYQVKASQYLLKPLDKDRLFSALDETVEAWEQERRAFFAVKTREGLLRLPLHRLVYGELADRCIRYHLADGSAVEGMSLRSSFRKGIAPLLEHRQFVLCSASFFVNLSYVDKVEPGGLRLTGGESIPLSRPLRAEITARWLDYHLERGKTV
ncbi:MAG: LytTR family DNA-binding domain-containing protein [Oscillospiraceae bacterium]|nr:LytTR family DNA-binding domain-containing protein [Oscillospiraceae bacterium]